MDLESARKANLLVGNHEGAPVLEILFAGAGFELLRAAELALTGADVDSGCPRWRSFSADSGFLITLASLRAGVWSYLAVRGGFVAPRWFKSASVDCARRFRRGCLGLGSLFACFESDLPRSSGISSRSSRFSFGNDSTEVPVISCLEGAWSGAKFLRSPFGRELSGRGLAASLRQSDRAGIPAGGPRAGTFRISHAERSPGRGHRSGSRKRPSDRVLRDGPTVGGYPRLCLLDPVRYFAIYSVPAPETCVRFRLVG